MSKLGSGSGSSLSSSPQLIRPKHVAISWPIFHTLNFFFSFKFNQVIKVQIQICEVFSNSKLIVKRTKYGLNNLRLPKSLWPTKKDARITKIYTIFVSTRNRHVMSCE